MALANFSPWPEILQRDTWCSLLFLFQQPIETYCFALSNCIVRSQLYLSRVKKAAGETQGHSLRMVILNPGMGKHPKRSALQHFSQRSQHSEPSVGCKTCMRAGKTGLREIKRWLWIVSVGQETSLACSRVSGTLVHKCAKGNTVKCSSWFAPEMLLHTESCGVLLLPSPPNYTWIPLGVCLHVFNPNVQNKSHDSHQNPSSLCEECYCGNVDWCNPGNSMAALLWNSGW